MLLFFFPILFGTFFQQLYNAVDAIIVGQFVGKEALSAVGGGTGTFINLLVGFFVGVSSGATVVISQYYGARNKGMVHSAVHTAIAFSILAGLLIMVVGIATAPTVLHAMATPADVLEPALMYIRIYFCGIIGNMIYNVGTGILRAIGDSKRPMVFLIIGCFTNIILDVVFVVFLRWGVAGAALATIISQAVSAVLVLAVLMRTGDMHRLELRRIRLEPRMFLSIIQIGLPAGLSSVMYSVSNLIIQSSVNSLGTAFGISLTTFVGQNYGAGKGDRVRKGMKVCLAMSAATTVFVSVMIYFFGIYFYNLFTTDAIVKEIGIDILRYLVPFYITYILIEILSGSLRGVGDCWMPTILCFMGICALRVIWITTAVPARRELHTILFSYPMTWSLTSVLYVIYFLFFSKLKVIKRKK